MEKSLVQCLGNRAGSRNTSCLPLVTAKEEKKKERLIGDMLHRLFHDFGFFTIHFLFIIGAYIIADEDGVQLTDS